jgi:thioredoxin reductase (NADPH)
MTTIRPGDEPNDVVILGAGPAGLTAGLYAHRAGLDVQIIAGHSPGGRVITHSLVENFPGFPGGVTGAELMINWLRQIIDATGKTPVSEVVLRVDFDHEIKEVYTEHSRFRAHAVIVATGAGPRRLAVAGESRFEANGVFYCAACDGPVLRRMARRRAAVVGGGDAAFHTALALLPHAESVTLITRASKPHAQSVMVERFLAEPQARILLERRVVDITGDRILTGLTLETLVSGARENLEFDAVFVGVGQSPMTDFLDGSLQLDGEGFIVTDNSLRTSSTGVLAAGDVRVTPLRQIVTAAADGALAAHVAAEYLRTGSWGTPSFS